MEELSNFVAFIFMFIVIGYSPWMLIRFCSWVRKQYLRRKTFYMREILKKEKKPKNTWIDVDYETARRQHTLITKKAWTDEDEEEYWESRLYPEKHSGIMDTILLMMLSAYVAHKHPWTWLALDQTVLSNDRDDL